jgi:predicted transposase YbfD/YdcC
MAAADRPATWPLSSCALVDLAEDGAVDVEPAALDLVDRFARLDDPRQARWVEHPLPAVLALCAAAVVAGMASFTAIAGWVTDVPTDLLNRLYIRCGKADPVAPSKATLWRVVTEINPVAADAVIGAWLLERAGQDHPADADGSRGGSDELAVGIAVDGKTLRGAKDVDGNQTHLLAAMTHTGLVAAQVEVGAKTNEIPKLSELLDPLDIAGTVVTADAMHTQRDTATYLNQRGADFFFCVKENQPTLYTRLDTLPWNDVPVSHTQTDRGHGRIERRTIQVLPAPPDLPFPHIQQVTLIERYIADLAGNPTSAVAVLGITSLTANHTTPAHLATLARQHWSIESLHWLRDTLYREDHSTTRTKAGPQVMAGLRNLAIGAIRTTGRTDITETTRWANRNMHRPFHLLGLN